MKKCNYLFLLLIVMSCFNSFVHAGKGDLEGRFWKLYLRADGTINQLIVNKENPDTIKFGQHQRFGPAFYVSSKRTDAFRDILQDETIGVWKKDGNLSYKTQVGDLGCSIKYKNINEQLALEVTVKNVGYTIVQPFKAGLKLGVDTYMDKYPNWLDAYFPTLLRNEKTHFWGYLMSPKQKIIILTSPDPIASWSVDYNYSSNKGKIKEGDNPYYWGQHRIEGINIDLMNALPLPERCPQNLYQLSPGQSYSWTLFITPASSIKEMAKIVPSNTHASFWNIPQTSLSVGEKSRLGIYSSEKPLVYLAGKNLKIIEERKGFYSFEFFANSPGHYVFKSQVGTKISEAIITVRHPWEWYLNRARSEAERCPQKATTHIESWYGYMSAFIAAKYMPEAAIDTRHTTRFDYLYNLLHKKDVPQIIPNRVQNTSGTIDLLVLKYKAHKNIEDIKKASNLADWLIANSQRKDGSFRNYLSLSKEETQGTIYTSVIYMAKSMLDLALLEKDLAHSDVEWEKNYQRHFASAKRAIDHLVSLHGNIQTEGEMTYEDGMIACTALQIAYLGLQEEVGSRKDVYRNEALNILLGHDCLTQLEIPDGRQRGGTMRFWESQYDILMVPNFMNSPHGWSAWRGYATYYTYLLTGDERWLQESYNAAGAFAELIDTKTGKLRWSFCANPFISAQMVSKPHPTASLDSITQYHMQPLDYKTNSFVLGEQYIDMIGNMMFFNTQDNDVHEVFKFIGEAFLNNAFVVERSDGSIKGYNCKVNKVGGILEVIPNEKFIERIHINVKGRKTILLTSKKGKKKYDVSSMTWISYPFQKNE